MQSGEENVDVGPVEDLHIIRADIRGDDVEPALPKRLGDAPTAIQTHLPLPTDTAK